MDTNNFYCYILRSTNPNFSSCTYNGSTTNLARRLRQHNGLIGGGAKATSGKGVWEYYAILTGFETWNEALSCEWKIKHPTGKKLRPKMYSGVEGRIQSLNLILNLNTWTSKSTGLESGREYTLHLADDVSHIVHNVNIKPNIKIKKIDELIF
jgi:structure-specific endonuclease subunit SLX1